MAGMSIDLPTTQVTRSRAGQGDPAGDVPVELQVLEHGAGLDLAHPGEEVRDQSDPGLGEVAGRLAEVRRADADVRVADQDRVVLAVPLHRRQVLDLRVEPEDRAADHELGVAAGELGEQPPDHVDRRIVGVGHAEEELEDRIVELEEAAEVLLEPLVDPLERLEDRDRRACSRARFRRGRVIQSSAANEMRVDRHREDGHQSEQQIDAWGTILEASPAGTAADGHRTARRTAHTIDDAQTHPADIAPRDQPGTARSGLHAELHRPLAARTDLRVADADGADLAEILGRAPLAVIVDLERHHLQIRQTRVAPAVNLDADGSGAARRGTERGSPHPKAAA